MSRLQVLAVAVLSITSGALVALLLVSAPASAQGGPSCNNAICYFHSFWPVYEDECRFRLDSACWYDDEGDINCQPCAAQ